MELRLHKARYDGHAPMPESNTPWVCIMGHGNGSPLFWFVFMGFLHKSRIPKAGIRFRRL